MLLNGVLYNIFDLVENGCGDDILIFVVFVDYYFMMGDNWDNLIDSCFVVGMVLKENLVGKV